MDNEIIIDQDVLVLALQIQRWKSEGQTDQQIKNELKRFCNLGWSTETLQHTAHQLLSNCDIWQIKSLFDLLNGVTEITDSKWATSIKTINQITTNNHSSLQ